MEVFCSSPVHSAGEHWGSLPRGTGKRDSRAASDSATLPPRAAGDTWHLSFLWSNVHNVILFCRLPRFWVMLWIILSELSKLPVRDPVQCGRKVCAVKSKWGMGMLENNVVTCLNFCKPRSSGAYLKRSSKCWISIDQKRICMHLMPGAESRPEQEIGNHGHHSLKVLGK